MNKNRNKERENQMQINEITWHAGQESGGLLLQRPLFKNTLISLNKYKNNLMLFGLPANPEHQLYGLQIIKTNSIHDQLNIILLLLVNLKL